MSFIQVNWELHDEKTSLQPTIKKTKGNPFNCQKPNRVLLKNIDSSYVYSKYIKTKKDVT
jgi:hypothetical protein